MYTLNVTNIISIYTGNPLVLEAEVYLRLCQSSASDTILKNLHSRNQNQQTD
jgi:hypothetical protein